MPNLYDGVDEIRNSEGVLLAPLGFGFSGAWETLERRVVSASTQEDFVFDETLYDAVRWTFVHLNFNTDGDEITIRTSSNGGSSFDAGAADYEALSDGARNQGGGDFEAEDNGTAQMRFGINTGNAAAESMSAELTLFAPDSDRHKLLQGQLTYVTGNPTPELTNMAFSGKRVSTSIINAIRFLPNSAGNYSGTIIMEGRLKEPNTLKSQDDWVVIDDQVGISAVATHDVFWDDQVWDEIQIDVWGATVGTDAQNLEWLLSTDGSTFLNGTNDYTYAISQVNESGTQTGANSSTGAISILAGPSLGTATDEDLDISMHIKNVSNTTRKKKFEFKWQGILSAALFNYGLGAGILNDNNNSIRGVRLDGQGATTFSADRIRVRGRRRTPIGVLRQDWEVIEHVELTGNQAEIEFTNIPAGEFDELELVLKDVDTDTSANAAILQFSANNGTSYDTGSNYHHALDIYAAETGFLELRSTTATSIQISGAFGSSAVRKLHGNVLFGPLDSGSRKFVNFQTSSLNDSANLRTISGGGMWFGTGSDGLITAFRLDLAAGGNFEAGSKFTLRGRRKV